MAMAMAMAVCGWGGSRWARRPRAPVTPALPPLPALRRAAIAFIRCRARGRGVLGLISWRLIRILVAGTRPVVGGCSLATSLIALRPSEGSLLGVRTVGARVPTTVEIIRSRRLRRPASSKVVVGTVAHSSGGTCESNHIDIDCLLILNRIFAFLNH